MKTKVKIALSASFWNIPACRAVLDFCDRIYTTNVGCYNELQDMFGAERIKVLPDACPETVKFIIARETSWHHDLGHEVEFITFSDLLKISNVYNERLDLQAKEIERLRAALSGLAIADGQIVEKEPELVKDAEYVRTLENALVAKEREVVNYKTLFEDREACLADRDKTIETLGMANTNLHQDLAHYRTTAAELGDQVREKQAKIDGLLYEFDILIEDQRRLNYLAKIGQYRPASEDTGVTTAYTEWGITAPANVSLRQQLDRLRAGLKYDKDNQPIAPTGYAAAAHLLSLSHAAFAKTHDPERVDSRISGDGPMPRDPMDQDHSV